MANFVLLNSENKVINIICVDDSDVTNNGGDFSTQAEEYIKNKYKLGNLKQYSRCHFYISEMESYRELMRPTE